MVSPLLESTILPLGYHVSICKKYNPKVKLYSIQVSAGKFILV